jgi:hypothetical protein
MESLLHYLPFVAAAYLGRAIVAPAKVSKGSDDA